MQQSVVETLEQASATSSVFTIVNACVGAGVLSFPFAFSCTGWLAGFVITAAVAACESYTLCVLSKYAEWTGSSSYGELVLKTLGPGAAITLSLVLLCYAWGSGVAYLIILGDCVQPFLEFGYGQVWFVDRRVVIGVLSCSTILPLCFPRTLMALSGASRVKFWGILGLLAAIMLRSVQLLLANPAPWADVKAVSFTSNFWSALPIIVFAFQCHTNIVDVFNELCDAPAFFENTLSNSRSSSGGESGALNAAQTAAAQIAVGGSVECLPGQWSKPGQHRPRSPKLLGMTRIIAVAISLVAVFYCLTGLFGYLGFPTTAHSNILTNFPADDFIIQVARALVGTFMIAVYPLNHNPGRTAVRDLVLQCTGVNCTGGGFNTLETLLFFGTNLLVALLVTDLGVIFQVVGGTCGAMVIFTFPGLILLKYAHSEHSMPKDLEEPLLTEPEVGPASQQAQQRLHRLQLGMHRPWASKAWWAGLGLLSISLGLFVITLHSVASAAH